jgi:hypothetical protein
VCSGIDAIIMRPDRAQAELMPRYPLARFTELRHASARAYAQCRTIAAATGASSSPEPMHFAVQPPTRYPKPPAVIEAELRERIPLGCRAQLPMPHQWHLQNETSTRRPTNVPGDAVIIGATQWLRQKAY